ncbi:MAG: cupin domain-containing protein [Pseudomonadota bacterium]
MSYFTIEKLEHVQALPGIQRSAVWLDRVMLTFFSFEPGAVVPEHAHANEQITIVVRGKMEFSLAGQVRILGAGDGVCIPPNVSHGARILDEQTVAYDAWNPPREDYMTCARAGASPKR